MPLTKTKLKSVTKMVASIPDHEYEATQTLFNRLKGIKKRGYLTRTQLISILRWKSPRPLRHYESNTTKEIKNITKIAFSTRNDCLKLHILTALTGVNYPSASAILMFYGAKKFPVLDIRVWKQLFAMGAVTVNPNGQAFSLKQCETYLNVIRSVAKNLNITARQAEKRLFDYDRLHQKGPLYGRKNLE